tara:strand:- start:21 stop:1904 length:1884 start_codon:yes stop_codon:yes gene_type:complete
VPPLECNDPNLSQTISAEDLYKNSSSSAKLYENDDVIIGYVVSSDEGGNIYKNISFVDSDGNGFNMAVDKYDTYTFYEPGRKVYINLKNLYTQVDFGGLEIGELYNNTQIGRIPELLIEDYIKRSCEVIDEESLVHKISLADISDDYLFSLIEVDNVQFKDDEVGENFYSSSNELGGATNRYIVDDKGYEIIVRTSSFADFANNPLPDGSGKIRGILTRFNDDYQLFMRSESDISMSGDRSTENILGLDALKSRPEGEISDNVFVEGIVTLSPANGNITDRNIIMQDETGGIVVRFDENIGTQVNEGDILRIALNGANLGSFADVKQISEVTYNGEIGGERIVTKVSENATLPDPIKVSLEDIKSGDYQSVIVEIENVQFLTDDVNKDVSGTRTITDCDSKISIFTRENASFANTKTPEGAGNIVGIASNYYADKQLLLRNTDNFSAMNKERCAEPEPLFYENFEDISNTGQGVWINLDGWENISESNGTEKWEARDFSSNSYASISAYQTGETNMTVWLITPEIDLNGSSDEILTFQSKDAWNNGDGLEVFISSNFSGNVSTASWTEIDAKLAEGTSTGFAQNFTDSGPIDLSSYSGKVRIAFKYTGGDPSLTTTYQIDEIKILGN